MYSPTPLLILMALFTFPTTAFGQQAKPPDQEPGLQVKRSSTATAANKPVAKPRFRRIKQTRTTPKPLIVEPSPSPVSVVSAPAEYLSGEASVTVKGNENPIVRLGLAASGVTLVEFPASDRFFALHPGNSEMVTIDESPTKQSDHFFVFRAGNTFVPPPVQKGNTGPAASIITQMRSGMVVTFLIYPVRELSQMAHRVVILYDRAEVVAARRAAGLAVNLEEKPEEHQERSIRIFGQPIGSNSRTGASENDEARPRTVKTNSSGSPGDGAGYKDTSGLSQRPSPVDSASSPDRDLASEARKALKMAITSSKLKNWTRPSHGLSIAASTPKDFDDREGTAIVILAVSNILPEPLRIVPGQPDLSVETREEKGDKALLVEQIKPLYVECSCIGDSIPARSTLYYAIVYRRPVLGVRQHLRVSVGQINAADDPALIDLTTSDR